jgi:SSS family solute:Na+ symporter
VALLIFSLIVAAYVIAGGLKAVMYTDALQGIIMFVGMAVLLVWAYMQLGGVKNAHQELSSMAGAAFPGHKAMGFQGWTAMPKFGWGEGRYDLWWIVVTTIVMGVGIGVLAQPQLSVRFMTVKSRKQLNRAVGVGGLFILLMTGVAFTVGALSNAYFFKHEVVEGKLVSVTDPAAVVAKRTRLGDTTLSCRLLHIDTKGEGVADTHIIERGLGKAEALLPHALVEDLGDGRVRVRPQATGFTRAVSQVGNDFMLNPDSIIPTYVISAMPPWFGLLFLLTLLAAAMSTLSSQFHTMGTALGRDVIEQVARVKHKGIGITRLGICIGLVIAVTIGFYARGGYIIARATSIFFGLCASAFLPTLLGGLFFKRMTRPAALASMIVGFVVTTFWVLLIKSAEAGDIGLVYAITGNQASILWNYPNWPNVDPLLVALPLSTLTAVVVSLLTRPPSAAHLAKCFGPAKTEAAPARPAELTRP